MKETLKPCPFCGSDGIVTSFSYHPTIETKGVMPWETYYSVECISCHVVLQGRIGYSTKSKAIKIWNKRVPERKDD